MNLKRLSAIALSAALTLTTVLAVNSLGTMEVHAAPSEDDFIDVSAGSSLDSKHVYFGANDNSYYVVDQTSDSLIMFSDTNLATSAYNSSGSGAGRYSQSTLKETLVGSDNNSGLLASNFTEKERALMQDVTVTNQYFDGADFVDDTAVTAKLYIPDAKDGYNGFGTTKIKFEGTSKELSLDNEFPGNVDSFWLRSPLGVLDHNALLAFPGGSVGGAFVAYVYGVRPALHLNLSSVIFSSAAPAATGDGVLTLDANHVQTIRYKDTAIGRAVWKSKTEIEVQDAVSGAYLVVQNASTAQAKSVTGTTTVSASEMGLTDFADCYIWIEKTEDRVTYAYDYISYGTYSVIEGANQSATKGSDASFKSDADYAKFVKVTVDGTELTQGTHYTAESGSTVVKLLGSYLSSLSVGSHTLTIESSDGEATTTFTVVAATSGGGSGGGSGTGGGTGSAGSSGSGSGLGSGSGSGSGSSGGSVITPSGSNTSSGSQMTYSTTPGVRDVSPKTGEDASDMRVLFAVLILSALGMVSVTVVRRHTR